MWVTPLPVVVGFLYVPEANQTGLRKPVHHAQREIKNPILTRRTEIRAPVKEVSNV